MKTPQPVRERLLDAADALMFVQGAFATPVDVILKAAGASPPSLYHHFGNKEGLITAALQRRLEIWSDVWAAEIDKADTDVDRLLALWAALDTYQSKFMTERWCAFTATNAAVLDPTPALRKVLEDETDLLRTRLLEHSKPIAGDDAQALADGLLIAYTGTMALMLRVPWQAAISQGRRTATALVRPYL